MELTELNEMTMRTGVNMDSMPFPDFDQPTLKLEGKMQHGYEVYSFTWNNTTIYGVKIGNEFASFAQMKLVNIPNFGKVAESINAKTKKEFAGRLLSYKLRYFLNKHLGVSIMLGSVHSIATENALQKITHLFDLNLINIKTGQVEPWSVDNYKKLTSISSPTDWQVLLKGASDHSFNTQMESNVDWCGDKGRHMWTYGDYFREFSTNELPEEYVGGQV